jgi:hypothetical protein
VTIARIVSGNARARERPEVRAKVEAYSRSRVGVQLSEEHKVRGSSSSAYDNEHVVMQQLLAMQLTTAASLAKQFRTCCV